MDLDSTLALEEYARQLIADRLAQAARDATARQVAHQSHRPRSAVRSLMRVMSPRLRHPLAQVRLWLRLARPTLPSLPLATACCPGGDLGTGGEAELGQHVADVFVDSALGDNEAMGDLAVGETLGAMGGNLALAGGERLLRPGRRSPRAERLSR